MIVAICFCDAIGDPSLLQYHGPVEVVKRKENDYTIKVNNRNATVFVDRLKPAFVVPDDSKENTAETRNILILAGQTNATIVADAV
jgi:hypothetical protein